MKTLTKKTHIAKVRQANREGIQQVCHLLQCSEQDYCNYIFDQYCKFIEDRYKGFPDVVANKILFSPVFRGVFNNAVASRDEAEFIPFAVDVTEEITIVNSSGDLDVIEAIPLGGDYLVYEWMQIHSYKRLLMDDQFINQFEHCLNLI